MGSGTIDAKITQSEYETGERILLLGKTNPNSLLTATLIDPNGKEIKTARVLHQTTLGCLLKKD